MSQSFAEALNWVPVSATLSATLGRAHEYARAQAYRTVTLEHLLLALVEDPDAGLVIQASGVDTTRMTADVSQHLGHSADRVPDGEPADPAADEALMRILDYAAAAARQSRRRDINGAIVLAAIVGEGHSVAASMLQAHGLTFEEAIKALQRSQPGQPLAASSQPAQPRPQAQAPSPPPSPSPVLQSLPVTQSAPQPIIPDLPSASSSSLTAGLTPGLSNGVAAQTNEQILANVRRRIDATRKLAKPKSGPAMPAREPYPAPPGSTAQPLSPRPDPAPLPPMPASTGDIEAAPSAVDSASARADSRSDQLAPVQTSSEYTGVYPEPSLVPEPSPPAFEEPRPPEAEPSAADVAETEAKLLESMSMGWQQPVETPPTDVARETTHRPPPLPPAPAAPTETRPPLAEVPPSPLRPRQHGLPVAPPSSVAWPEPVTPQPNALPPARPRISKTPSPYNSASAGQAYPETEWAPPPPPAGIPVPVQRTKVPKSQPVKRAPAQVPSEPMQLTENIPRSMQAGQPQTVEVRIAKSYLQTSAGAMAGAQKSYLHELIVTKAVSVRLRAPDGGFAIETGSPETQWLDNNSVVTAEDFASWRWNVTPAKRGAARLQLVVSTRTIASDGLTADTALPDEVFDIAVKPNYRRVLVRAAGWVGLMIAGAVLSKLGQNGFETVATLWRGFE
jgi:neural Wiskott-Aldrich syndrome protein